MQGQQIGCLAMVLGMVVLTIYWFIHEAYMYMANLWRHTLFPFFNGPVWAVIVIALSAAVAYGLYLEESGEGDEEEAAALPPESGNGQENQPVQAHPAIPPIPPTAAGEPKNTAPGGAPGLPNSTLGGMSGPVYIRSFETGGGPDSKSKESDQGKEGK